jgi:hypothetical protein
MPYINVDVDVELDEIDTDDLISELDRRGYDYNTHGVDADEARALLENVYQLRRTGENYQTDLDKLIYSVLGKIV